MNFSLADCKIGDKAYLKEISDEQLKVQLYNLGCVQGEEITIERKALFGDPILICVNDNFISLRKDDARKIEITLK